MGYRIEQVSCFLFVRRRRTTESRIYLTHLLDDRHGRLIILMGFTVLPTAGFAAFGKIQTFPVKKCNFRI